MQEGKPGMTTVNHLFCKASLPTDSKPKFLLQFYQNHNHNYIITNHNSFSFLPVTVENCAHHMVNSTSPDLLPAHTKVT